MTFLLDTSAFSAAMGEDPRMSARLASVSSLDRVVICSVVRGEILYGIRRLAPGKRQRELEAKANRLFASIPCEPVPEGAGGYYATVKVSRQRAGLTLDENDLWIAATCLALGAVLVTRDTDFLQTVGLTLEDWTV